jgi:hypothetical protein
VGSKSHSSDNTVNPVVLLYPMDRRQDLGLDESPGRFVTDTSEHHAPADSNRPEALNEGLVVEAKDHQVVSIHVQAVVQALYPISSIGELMIMRQIYDV